MKVFIGADHRGFKLKDKLKDWLIQEGYQVTDCGNTVLDTEDDYPDFAFALADAVVNNSGSRGVLLCGTGTGVAIAANKISGARCSLGLNPAHIKRSRQEDDINILALAADFVNEAQAKEMLDVFLTTDFFVKDRYARRIHKIASRELGHA